MLLDCPLDQERLGRYTGLLQSSVSESVSYYRSSSLTKQKKIFDFFRKNDAKHVYWSYQGKICPYLGFDPARPDPARPGPTRPGPA